MENQGKVQTFFKNLPSRLGAYFKDYFKKLNYPAWIICVLASVGLFLLDYFTKRVAYADSRLQAGEIVDFIPGFISFYLVGNKGAAWGSLSGWSWFLIPVSMIASIMLLVNLLFRFRKYNWGMTIGITLMLPGAVGNLADRIGLAAQLEPYRHGVIDFLRFTFWPSFPICNVADYCLTLGIIVLLVGFAFEFRKEYQQLKNEEKQEKEATMDPAKKDDMERKLAEMEQKNGSSKEGDEDGKTGI